MAYTRRPSKARKAVAATKARKAAAAAAAAKPSAPAGDLSRFVRALAGRTDKLPSHAQAMAEVRAGCKRTHWAWYVFPQLAGLSTSEHGRYWAIADLAEARRFLQSPDGLAGSLACTIATIALEPGRVPKGKGKGAGKGKGKGKGAEPLPISLIDRSKLHACVTLFALVAEDMCDELGLDGGDGEWGILTLCAKVLERFFDNEYHDQTVDMVFTMRARRTEAEVAAGTREELEKVRAEFRASRQRVAW